MPRNYYLMSNGRIKRQDNTLFIENADGTKRPLPVEDVDTLYLYGEVDLNTKLLTFLTRQRITLHVFNYYGFYAGSYYPREYLHSGYLLVQQVSFYGDLAKRLPIAREFVNGAAHGLLKTLGYYERRKDSGSKDSGGVENETAPVAAKETNEADVIEAESSIDAGLIAPELNEPPVTMEEWERDAPFPVAPVSGTRTKQLASIRLTVSTLAGLTAAQADVNALRGIEGKMRERYYAAWPLILSDDWEFTRRVRRPPNNEVNALISFGNSYLYTVCLSEIYRTQLTPTISYLHEPGARRFSLALDISEIFKPLIIDRTIFTLMNKGQLKPEHFDNTPGVGNGEPICYLNETGKKLFITALEERLKTTIAHRQLKRHVSYRHLIRLECYKLIRHLTGVEDYRAFRAWW